MQLLARPMPGDDFKEVIFSGSSIGFSTGGGSEGHGSVELSLDDSIEVDEP